MTCSISLLFSQSRNTTSHSFIGTVLVLLRTHTYNNHHFFFPFRSLVAWFVIFCDPHLTLQITTPRIVEQHKIIFHMDIFLGIIHLYTDVWLQI